MVAMLPGTAEVSRPGKPERCRVCQGDDATQGGRDLLLDSRLKYRPGDGARRIYDAAAGQAGLVFVGLTPPTDGSSEACVGTLADRALINDVRKNPSDYYVNVHNTGFPAGIPRG